MSSNWIRLTDWFLIIIYVNDNIGRPSLLENFLIISSVNVLGAHFCRFSMESKYTGFGLKFTYLENLITHG